MQVMAAVILEEYLVCLDCSELHIHGSSQLACMGAVSLLCTETTKNKHGLLCERTGVVYINTQSVPRCKYLPPRLQKPVIDC